MYIRNRCDAVLKRRSDVGGIVLSFNVDDSDNPHGAPEEECATAGTLFWLR